MSEERRERLSKTLLTEMSATDLHWLGATAEDTESGADLEMRCVHELERRDTELTRLREIEEAYRTRVMPTDEELRKEFEEWATRIYGEPPEPSEHSIGGYLELEVQALWDGYKAGARRGV